MTNGKTVFAPPYSATQFGMHDRLVMRRPIGAIGVYSSHRTGFLKRGVATPFGVAGSFDRAANVSWSRGVAWGREQS